MTSNTQLSRSDHGTQTVQPLDPYDEARTTNELHTQRENQTMVLNQFERLKRIGTGQHGEVYVAWDRMTASLVAIKGMKRKNPKEDKWMLLRKDNIQASPHTPITDRLGAAEKKIRKEIAIMKKCRHAHVVRLLEVIDDRMQHKIYMVMEFLGGGEIKWRNVDHEPILHVDQIRRICRDAILGLEYLHYQGIIHRDIKPANLLWTEDRQQVKISDFGVSHFSTALRMAATKPGQVVVDNPSDPRILDDSELSKRAGTPAFLAPEVNHEYKRETSSPQAKSEGPLNLLESQYWHRSTSTVQLPFSRPPVTKSIDVWAFGITLYCLLFGRVPFLHSNMFKTFDLIANSDWGVDDTMGFDRVPTHGRHPPAGDESEGAVVMRILDKMLQKDARDRMTLDEFKSHPWITRDIPDVDEWLRETSPSKNDVVMVSDMETQSAMSSVNRREGWHQRIKRRISTLLHTVRPHPSSRSVGQVENDKYGSGSAPHLEGHHQKPNVERRGSELHRKGKKVDHKEKGKGVDPQEKGKGRAKNRPKTTRHESGSTVASTSTGRSRRGSETLLVPEGSEYVSHSPEANSPTSTRTLDEHMFSKKRPGLDKPRNRFSVRSLTERWRPHKTPSNEWTRPEASTSTLSSGESYTYTSNHAGPSGARKNIPDTGRFSPVLFARRASSWGDVGEYEDVLSLNSGGDDEPIARDTLMYGAGGVANEPAYGTPTSGAFPSAAAAASAVPSAPRQAQPERSLRNNPIPAAADSALQDINFSRQVHIRSQTASPSPLAHVTYRSDVDLGRTFCDEGSDDSLSYGEIVQSTHYQGSSHPDAPPAGSSQIYETIEDEGSDEENMPIEVRRRRPSVAIAAASPSPPVDGEPL